MTVKYGLTLSKADPSKYLNTVKLQDSLNDDQKEKLSAILLQVPKNAVLEAASLVTDHWLPHTENRRQSMYNLAFLLLLESLYVFSTWQEASGFDKLSIFLYKLEQEVYEF